jgi:Protein of unknown function (DUF3592)
MLVATIAGVILLAVGLAGVSYGLWNLLQGASSPKWPTVTGQVVTADLQRSRDAQGMVTYRAEVAYKYEVGGQPYVSDRVFFGDQLSVSWATGAVREVEDYHPGTQVKVFYNPGKPSRSVLEPGAPWQVYVVLLTAAALLGFGIAILLGMVPVNGERAA